MYIMITGPEKTGKTSLATALAAKSKKLGIDAAHIRSRGRSNLDLRVYLAGLELGVRNDILVIADRGWPDEFVYSQLLSRPSPLVSYPGLLDKFEEALKTMGFGVTLAPPKRRAPLGADDHQVSYEEEVAKYLEYSSAWDYLVIPEQKVSVTWLAEWLLIKMKNDHMCTARADLPLTQNNE